LSDSSSLKMLILRAGSQRDLCP